MKLTENECKLVEGNFPLVYWFAATKYPSEMALITSKIDSDDLVELAFVAICKAAQTYKPGSGKFSTWFTKIAKREVLQEIRRNNRNNRKVLTFSTSYDAEVSEDVGSSVLNLLPSDEPDLLDRVISNDLRFDMRRLINTAMTKTQLETFKMWHFGGKTQREISEQVGIGQSRVSRRITRGTARLSKSMRDLGYEGSDVV